LSPLGSSGPPEKIEGGTAVPAVKEVWPGCSSVGILARHLLKTEFSWLFSKPRDTEIAQFHATTFKNSFHIRRAFDLPLFRLPCPK
jgi:hypothetical protein